MPGSTNFLQFDSTASNMMTDAHYAGSAQQLTGFQTGVASSQVFNKILFQSSTMVAALSKVFANLGYSVSDANITSLTTVLSNLLTNAGGTLNSGATITLGRDPVASMDATSKEYVDSAISVVTIAIEKAKLPAGTKIDTFCTSPPEGFLRCDGSAVSRTTYLDLFNAIGVTYGVGNGTTTFTLPNCNDRFPLGLGTTYSGLGMTGGESTHKLTPAEMPSHIHSITPPNCASQPNGGYTVSGNDSIGTEPINSYNSDSAGGDGTHNNMPPFITSMVCIKY